jgi:hypothetical protein
MLKHKLKERASMGEATIIGIDLAKNVCGHSLKISGSYDPDALARLIRGLIA